ncbi:MAG: glutamate synthase [Rhodospirillaceae bacterium]|jgi:CDGSH-type Zn-finger protein|nr:glutamate synthase [Rhodospirillaceae bacterium]|tara:strand:+ start:373 stop:615 length:243 start_codon:yes stop_codon:yes gene_type:complete
MADPIIVQKKPYHVEVTEGKKYAWCTCGLSEKQPFCDGKHKADENFKPEVFTAEKTEELHLCGCKYSKNGRNCDGTHKSL